MNITVVISKFCIKPSMKGHKHERIYFTTCNKARYWSPGYAKSAYPGSGKGDFNMAIKPIFHDIILSQAHLVINLYTVTVNFLTYNLPLRISGPTTSSVI